MTLTYLELGPSPVDEDCLQMGVASNEDCKAECVRYMQLLARLLPIPEDLQAAGVKYVVKWFPYDAPAGGYYEVIIRYDDSVEAESAFAYNVETTLPLTWED